METISRNNWLHCLNVTQVDGNNQWKKLAALPERYASRWKQLVETTGCTVWTVNNSLETATLFSPPPKKKIKVKASMARILPVKNLLPQFVGSISNYLQYTEVGQWGALSCSRPQPATDNGVWNGTSSWLAVTSHPTLGSTTLHDANAGRKLQYLLQLRGRQPATFGMRGHRTACMFGHWRYHVLYCKFDFKC